MLRLLAFLLVLAPASAETLQLDEWTGLAPDPAVTYRGSRRSPGTTFSA